MMNMKYLSLFEKFKSVKLSKTLGYIKDDNDFLKIVKVIANNYDFPYSELSDDMFEYLPFNSALKINKEIDRTPKKCDGESEWIPGEFCDEGKVKRTWGKGFRITTCSKCGGTGFLKPKTEPDIYCIKFWFDSEGHLVATTSSDGTIKDQSSSGNEIDKYDRLESYEPSQIKSSPLKTGDKIYMRKDGSYYLCTFWRDISGDNTCYAIGNGFGSGDRPNDNVNGEQGDWKRFGGNSWALGSGDHGTITKLELKKDDKSSAEQNPYNWNYRTSISRYGIEVSKGYSTEPTLKDAHFAIVMFLDRLRSNDFKKGRDIKMGREESRKGALKLKKDEAIKKENIERYIDQLSGKFSLADGISGITKVLPRVLGGKENIVYYVQQGRNMSQINDIINYIFRFMKEGSTDSVKEDSIDSIKYNLKSIYSSNIKFNGYLNNNIKEIRKYLQSGSGEANNYIYINEVLDELEKLSAKIYSKIDVNIESIEDMEVVLSKLRSIKEIMNKDRYSIRYLNSYISYLGSDSGIRNAKHYLTSYVTPERYKDIINDIKIVGNIIDKI